ncbi:MULTISPECIES: hypothetical protein [unclassified Polynucleobacter]|jgi:hypothetical protein|uniref:hypothetical protein n=1 Tax=unclassified Polynucleobacter TaxID=2640945 RepID=UPI0008B9B92B|nr:MULTISPECIES: hypothetical protein [unclassified Polynucleobacter]OHC10105.1 MAG: hypothetical protein A2X74_10125 [Polynucleobacter sp. GWA2_45_21]
MSDILIGLYANFLHRLLDIAGKRDFIPAPEVAQVFNVASQTVRKNYSLTGEAYGIRPTKIGNRLLWSVAQIADKLRGAL